MIAELFLEGQPLFELSQLLAYRRGQYDPSQHLEKVNNTAPASSPTLTLIYYSAHELRWFSWVSIDTRSWNSQNDSPHDPTGA